MIILAIDTASRSCSVAVVNDDDILSEITDVSGQTHSRHLMTMVDKALSMSVEHLDKIDAFAVTRGPGSFTGLRIGIATAKGLAEAAGRPLLGISSLQALAWQVFQANVVLVPMLDARRREVYAGRFTCDGSRLKALGEEGVFAPEKAVEGIATPCLLVGDGAVVYEDRLRSVLGQRMRMALPFQHIIKASTIAYLARRRLGVTEDERMRLTPRYIRKSYVEEGRLQAR